MSFWFWNHFDENFKQLVSSSYIVYIVSFYGSSEDNKYYLFLPILQVKGGPDVRIQVDTLVIYSVVQTSSTPKMGLQLAETLGIKHLFIK